MTWWRDPALASGVALEAVAVLAAIDGAGALALAAHVGSCGAIAIGLGERLPAGAAAARLAFAVALFVPILGALGWFVTASVRAPARHRPGPAIVRTPIPGPEAARVQALRPRVAPGASPASARVVAARGRDDPGAIALLRRALAHPDEEVRLVAHAVLESKHRVAYQRVHDGARDLDGAPIERRATLHRRLAAEHWEIARTGLAEGECLVHALDSARDHARAARAEHAGDAALAVLVAHIELRRGQVAEAEAALARAVALGLPEAVAQPYLAEAAFLDRRFDRVRDRLGDGHAAGNLALHRIRRFWS